MKKTWMVIVALLFFANAAQATLLIPIYDNAGKELGTVRADDTIYGVILTPDLKYLPPGFHGFHIYSEGICCGGGLKPGGHYDPDETHIHRGPYELGHLGDLPVLIVNEKGKAKLPVLAPRLKLAFITGKSLVIDEGGDNYNDVPRRLGGGGPAIACGVVPYH